MMTNELTAKKRCLALFSGGLDSILSVIWMTKLGYEVIPITFSTPFFPTDKAKVSAELNGLNLVVRNILPEHLVMLKNPRYGFGRNANPCIDCHALMISLAGALLPEYNAGFIITGEVLGQRPMSQTKRSLTTVAKLSGYEDLVVRPLSQQLLEDSLPIREGWINKEALLSIKGRSRKTQIALAKELGVVSYPAPGGGCLLTNPDYSLRIRDLLEHDNTSSTEIELLKYGRHFRISSGLKLILARTGKEMEEAYNKYPDQYFMRSLSHSGPWAILRGEDFGDADLQLAANILLSYCAKAPENAPVVWGKASSFDHEIDASKLPREAFLPLLLSTDKEIKC